MSSVEPPSGLDIRQAEPGDVAAVVRLIADDTLGSLREDPSDLEPYWRVFEVIHRDPKQRLAVASFGGSVIGTLQLVIIPGLSHRGSTRALIETVHVEEAKRGKGVGSALIGWAIKSARQEGCVLIQLTSDNRRPDAHRFYKRLGFVASHVGFKLSLATGDTS